MRLCCYVDGFNLYHSIHDLRQPHLKWLDLWALGASLARNGEAVAAVHYFSAYATWRPAPYARHRAYVSALQSRGVTVHLAQFKAKDKRCFNCQHRWQDHEEKETDVHVALRLLADAFEDAFDRAILISADSDLVPVVAMVRQKFPRKQVMVVAPPGRFAAARALAPQLQITKGRLARCLLPQKVHDDVGNLVAERPASYEPP